MILAELVQYLLTITSNLTGAEIIDDIYLNYAGDPTTLAGAWTYQSGVAANSLSFASNAFKADGDGYFDIILNYPPPGNPTFGAGDTSSYLFTLAGLTASDFDLSSFCDTGCGNGSYFAAAHVQRIVTAPGSGWVGDGDGSGPGTPGPGTPGTPGPGGGNVPEPSGLLLLGFGAVFAARRLRRR